MNESTPAPNTKECVFGDFYTELEEAPDKQAVLRKYADAYPEWAQDFYEEAELEQVLGRSQPYDSDDIPKLPDFRIIREIARGGMGVVYEAQQLALKRRVAVKVRRGRPAPGAHDRFLMEQKVLAQLHQTHIVPIHTAGQAGPWQYFAMAYIEGAALHRVVRATRHHTTRQGATTPTLAELAGEVVRQDEGKAKTVGSGVKQTPEDAGTGPTSNSTRHL